jgi:hypothetical protein
MFEDERDYYLRELVAAMLSVDPCDRPSATKALASPFLKASSVLCTGTVEA